jgi:hypothetical protein
VAERPDDEGWDEEPHNASEGGGNEEEPKNIATRVHGEVKFYCAFDCKQCSKELVLVFRTRRDKKSPPKRSLDGALLDSH